MNDISVRQSQNTKDKIIILFLSSGTKKLNHKLLVKKVIHFILALDITLSKGDSILFLESHFLYDSLHYGNLNLARQHSLPLPDMKELDFLHEKNA